MTAPIPSEVTHYGESYNGQILGCGYGYYSSDDPTIVAVSPERYGEMPCGTQLQICGSGGCILAQRQDACPGCPASVFDLSEAAFMGVCGVDSGVCDATVSVVVTCDVELGWEDRPQPPAAAPNLMRHAGGPSDTAGDQSESRPAAAPTACDR